MKDRRCETRRPSFLASDNALQELLRLPTTCKPFHLRRLSLLAPDNALHLQELLRLNTTCKPIHFSGRHLGPLLSSGPVALANTVSASSETK